MLAYLYSPFRRTSLTTIRPITQKMDKELKKELKNWNKTTISSALNYFRKSVHTGFSFFIINETTLQFSKSGSIS